LKLYKQIVNKYIKFLIAKENIDDQKSNQEDIMFLAFLDVILYFAYAVFAVFAAISTYLLVTREVLPYV